MNTEFRIRSFIGTADVDWQDPGLHQHPTFEISVLLEGRGVFEWSQGKHLLEAGHVVLIPSRIPHLFEGFGRNRYGVIHLEGIPSQITELLNMLVSEGTPTLFALSRLDKERFERLFREWQRIKSSQLKEPTRNYISWTEVMVLFLLEHSQKDQQSLTIAKAADYIRENLHEGVQISGMAALAGFSETGFRRLFEQIYHMSPKKYQQQCRMTEAKWLLSSSDKEMMEIASQIGFTRLHSFSQWFKSAEGVSPTEWRKMQKRG
ncbi:helix-turn-helix domain-containing protein [Paenibacillus spongiae]|uniref:AraC family transcriptional regulator n=1 Tax=Paenibacillus spongiae TaxID=2909671 RepID=A0ABY5SAV9_9BACL|nr:AraC family transcriptional regulator [Paenibacillus spongiae]UVI31081.1 AraC family transcriptional regulator [Paenibacillus spongiae]